MTRPALWSLCFSCHKRTRVLDGQLHLHCCPIAGKVYVCHNVGRE